MHKPPRSQTGESRAKTRFVGLLTGFEPIACPVALPINWRGLEKGGGIVPAESSGAMVFTFQAGAQTFHVLYVCLSYHNIHGQVQLTPIGLCPHAALNLYELIESICDKATKRVEPGQKIQVIGGPERSFEAVVEWDEVVLAEPLKCGM